MHEAQREESHFLPRHLSFHNSMFHAPNNTMQESVHIKSTQCGRSSCWTNTQLKGRWWASTKHFYWCIINPQRVGWLAEESRLKEVSDHIRWIHWKEETTKMQQNLPLHGVYFSLHRFHSCLHTTALSGYMPFTIPIRLKRTCLQALLWSMCV